jgi:glycerol-3-phosphate dehydrogenase
MESFDIIVIGGGASGLGIAVDGASRGYSVLLLEKSDFGKGTSSRSTKLVHGGVRYLQNGDISLVFQALRERGYFIKNAPHLVSEQEFVIPVYHFFKIVYFGLGLKLYDLLSFKHRFGSTRILSKKETIEKIPNVNKKGLIGSISYYDGVFDDARMIVSLAQTARKLGATLLNYAEVIGFEKEHLAISGVEYLDRLTNQKKKIKAKVVVNATGVFSDQIFRLDIPKTKKIIVPSQGVHLVVDSSFLGSDKALLVPKTSDGRVLFAVPWNGKTILGTTDTKVNEVEDDPVPLQEEIDFILNNARDYLENKPSRKDVKSVFAGLRPLAAPKTENESTKEVSRSHKIVETDSGLISILGGKWTTYRKMAEDVVNYCIHKGKIGHQLCTTRNLKLYGYQLNGSDNYYKNYGSQAEEIKNLTLEVNGNISLAASFFITPNIIRWSVRMEMAKTLDDVLSRRTRGLFIDAGEALEVAPKVAAIMAEELQKGEDWIADQLKDFTLIAQKYTI